MAWTIDADDLENQALLELGISQPPSFSLKPRPEFVAWDPDEEPATKERTEALEKAPKFHQHCIGDDGVLRGRWSAMLPAPTGKGMNSYVPMSEWTPCACPDRDAIHVKLRAEQNAARQQYWDMRAAANRARLNGGASSASQ